MYVGLPRKRRTIDLKGRIRHPFQISRKVAHTQITKINDHILVMGIGIVNQYYSLDGSQVERLFNRRRLRSLATKWKGRSRSAIARFRAMQKAPEDVIISL